MDVLGDVTVDHKLKRGVQIRALDTEHATQIFQSIWQNGILFDNNIPLICPPSFIENVDELWERAPLRDTAVSAIPMIRWSKKALEAKRVWGPGGQHRITASRWAKERRQTEIMFAKSRIAEAKVREVQANDPAQQEKFIEPTSGEKAGQGVRYWEDKLSLLEDELSKDGLWVVAIYSEGKSTSLKYCSLLSHSFIRHFAPKHRLECVRALGRYQPLPPAPVRRYRRAVYDCLEFSVCVPGRSKSASDRLSTGGLRQRREEYQAAEVAQQRRCPLVFGRPFRLRSAPLPQIGCDARLHIGHHYDGLRLFRGELPIAVVNLRLADCPYINIGLCEHRRHVRARSPPDLLRLPMAGGSAL